MTKETIQINFSEIPSKFNIKREIGTVVHPCDVTEASIAIETVDVLHILVFNLDIEDVKVLLNARLVD